MLIFSQFERIGLQSIMFASGLKFLLSGPKHINVLIFLGGVQFGPFGIFFEDHFLFVGLDIRQLNTLEVVVLEKSG